MSPTSSVWPSAGDFITASTAMIPLAPGLFSTTMDCPTLSPIFCATRRAITSGSPPGA